MVSKIVKFIVLRPRGIPQNLETEVNCSELISCIKNKLFSEDVKKECNIRLIYMGKVLDDKKKLEDYVNYYQKEFFLNNDNNNNSNTSDSNLANEEQDNTNASNKTVDGNTINNTQENNNNDNNNDNNNNNNIPITIHVKITEKSACPKPTYMESKSVNTFLSQLSFLSLLILLWLYKYNYSHIFPMFSTTVLVVFTFFVLCTVFQFYVISLYCIFVQILVVIWTFLKNYSIRIYLYLKDLKQKLYSKLKTIGITQTHRTTEIKED